MERYHNLEKRGEGAYGAVYKSKDIQTGKIVALKKILMDTSDEGIPSTSLREISILRTLDHPDIVLLSDCVQVDHRLWLVFEYVDMDLKKYMDQVQGKLDPQVVQSFMFQLLRGMEFCHKRGILHRDLKPHNLLVSNGLKLKIADFGLARSFAPPIRPLTHEVVTLWYRPPEILLGSPTYAPPVDMWGVGTILAELVSKRPLFPGDSEVDELFKIFQACGTPNDDDWPGVTNLPAWNPAFPKWKAQELTHCCQGLTPLAADLLENLLAQNPTKRLSARAALKHSYFNGFEESSIPAA